MADSYDLIRVVVVEFSVVDGQLNVSWRFHLEIRISDVVEEGALKKPAGWHSEVRVELVHVLNDLSKARIRLAVFALELDLWHIALHLGDVLNLGIHRQETFVIFTELAEHI